MDDGINVLSLFDGMSCGQIALNRANIKYKNYYASEIDKYAIKVAMSNYPDTIQIGSVTEVKAENLPKIDLLIGGGPCQGFSVCGKQLNFDDPRSKLFFEFVRIKNETNPTFFLFENVRMKQEWQDIISEHLGVKPIMINSALVSAQNRERLYWTNIPCISQPEDKQIFIRDILECQNKIPVIKNRGALTYKPKKSTCLDANYFKGVDNHGQRTGCIEVGKADLNGHDFLKRIYSPEGKSPTLTAVCGGNQERKIAVDSSHWRKLTPVECERLQTLPDNYTSGISDTQRYKCIGNGWTVDVIAHIFSFIKDGKDDS